MTSRRAEAIGRLGGPAVRCGSCETHVMEAEAFALRRLWIDRERGSKTHGDRIFYWACSRACAEKIEADSWVRHRAHPDSDAALWIDDFRVVTGW